MDEHTKLSSLYLTGCMTTTPKCASKHYTERTVPAPIRLDENAIIAIRKALFPTIEGLQQYVDTFLS